MNKIVHIYGICFLLFFISSPLSAQSWGDYTLIAVQGQTKATLVDNNKQVYHTWNSLSGKTGYSSYLLEGCILLRTVEANNNTFSGGSSTGRVQKVAKDGTILWDYTHSSTSYCLHHDILPMPNGNILMIAYELKTAAEATQAGSSTSHVIWSEKIIEVEPTGTSGGNIVWEWHLWDHLVQNANSSKDNYGVIADHPELLNINYKNTSSTRDWIHANGLDYDPELDQILLSSHNMNEIYVIDHSTTTAEAAGHTGGNSGKGGDFLYRWGNPAAYNATGSTILNVVHSPRFIPQSYPHGGYMLAFNNNGTSTKSTVEMFLPPRNGYNYTKTAGSAYSPLSSFKTFTCNGRTNNMGGVQILPNGNMLICIAQSGLIYEIDSTGTTIWSYSAGGVVPKTSRYSEAFVNGTTTGSGVVKFSVDMTGQTINASGIFVTGDFQEEAGMGDNWTAGMVPLTQETGTNIYSTVLQLSPDTKYEYKFLNGSLFYNAEFVPDESRVGYDFNDNRWIYTGNNDTTYTGAILFGQNAPQDRYLLRVKVDMQQVSSISQEGVFVKGDFDWGSLPLYNFEDNVYEGIVYASTGTATYKFYNGSSSAETVPGECAVSGSRTVSLAEDTVLDAICYAACVDCATVGIPDMTKDTMEMTVFPNPCKESATIRFSEPVTNANIILYNIRGEKIRAVEFSGTEWQLERGNLPSGIYMIQLSHSQTSKYMKVLFE